MAALDIDAIYQALFDRVSDSLAGTLKLATRRSEHFESSLSQPAMLMLASDVQPTQTKGLPITWRLGAKFVFYLKATDGLASPETPLLSLVAQLEAALQRQWDEAAVPDSDEWGTSLGGLVSSIQMTNVELEQGIDGGQGIAIVDVVMVTHT